MKTTTRRLVAMALAFLVSRTTATAGRTLSRGSARTSVNRNTNVSVNRNVNLSTLGVVLCCRVLRSSPKTVGVGAERATG